MIAKKTSDGIVGSRFLAFQAKPETACKPVGNLLLVFHGLSAFEQPRRDIRKGGGNQHSRFCVFLLLAFGRKPLPLPPLGKYGA